MWKCLLKEISPLGLNGKGEKLYIATVTYSNKQVHVLVRPQSYLNGFVQSETT
jgi:hypothetical protein